MKKGFRILLLSGLLFSSFLSGPLTAFAETSDYNSESEVVTSSETGSTVPNLTNGIEDSNVMSRATTDNQLASESIDDWMPDKYLQQQILNQIYIFHPEITSPEDITKELLGGIDLYITTVDGDVENLKGIEYAKSYSIMFSNAALSTTEALSNFIGGYLDNLEQFNFYGFSSLSDFAQIDFATVFRNWKYFHYLDSGENIHFIDTGQIGHKSSTALNIPVSSYSENGELRISLNEIGLWSSLDTKLLTDPSVLLPVKNLLFKDDQGNTLATYNYSSFDVATQSVIFKFDAQNSKSPEELSGQQLSYSLTTFLDDSAPNFNFGGFGSNFSDFIQNQFHFYIYFSEVNFLTPALPAADVTVKYVDEAGNSIASQETVTGNVGDTYTAVQKTIDGYTFKEVQGNPTGTLTDEPQTVTYVYTKDKVSPSKNTNDTTPKTKKSNQSLPKTSAVDNKVLTVMGILMLVMMIPFSWYRKRSQK